MIKFLNSKLVFPFVVVSLLLAFTACNEVEVVEKDFWLGDPCECEDSPGECSAMGLVPLPTGGEGTIKGCEAVEDVEGAKKVCLRYYEGTKNGDVEVLLGPKTLFPGGFCSLSAVGCDAISEGAGFVCGFAAYGEVDKMTACPAGSTLISGEFKMEIMGFQVGITNKTCAPNCHTEEDCRAGEGYSCIKEGDHSFCYSKPNLDTFTDGYTLTRF